MKIIRSVDEMRSLASGLRAKGVSIGFVPTMGALHEGHLSLVKEAKSKNDFVIVSIFVNPTQFLPGEDFEKYPRNESADLGMLQDLEVDCVFLPLVHEMYPTDSSVSFSCSVLTNVLCGITRPGHFEGVMLVLSKFFNIIIPNVVYLGQKDYQQYLIVCTLVRDLLLDIQVKMMPTVRADDGLALSSRNVYLDIVQRKQASLLFKAFEKMQSAMVAGENNVGKLILLMKDVLSQGELLKPDYVEILCGDTLQKVEILQKGRYVAAVAVYVGNVRLIDNFVFDV